MHPLADQVFYHIYPLGLCGAPAEATPGMPPVNRLDMLHPWAAHMRRLGVTALYIGPLFASQTHGYDTSDYYHVDPRLGSNEDLARLVGVLHDHGIRVLLDGVFNHVGRDFWAFRDLLANGEHSPYRDWFAQVRFDQRSPYGDPFSYETWGGHASLVKLNLHNHELRQHLFGAVRMWAEQLGIDGLRLDAADVMDLGFLSELASFCRSLRPDFWLIGEVIHGDYRQWANPATLDATTNYEAYKGLYSSHNDRNMFEIGYALNRQFGPGGIYRDLPLYSFADNHDVTRVASVLGNPAHLYPLHCLLFTMPGVPSIYYGSEWGIPGIKPQRGSDAVLRPALDLASASASAPHADLAPVIARLAALRAAIPALRHGSYQQLHVAAEQLVFLREHNGQRVVVAVNSSDAPAPIALNLPFPAGSASDTLNPGAPIICEGQRVQFEIPANWARVIAFT